MFNRKMKTKLPQMKKKMKESDLDKEIREKHDKEKENRRATQIREEEAKKKK